MKGFLQRILTGLLVGVCWQTGSAATVEYEFLTPQVVVIKAPKPYMYTTHSIAKNSLWQKENALLRDENGNILKKADISGFEYIIFKKA